MFSEIRRAGMAVRTDEAWPRRKLARPIGVGRLFSVRGLFSLRPIVDRPGGIWLSFWSFVENKGSNWVRFVFDFGFVQGSPSSFGRCNQSGFFRFRVTFRDIRPVRNRPKG
jgi:hypothetical protein